VGDIREVATAVVVVIIVPKTVGEAIGGPSVACDIIVADCGPRREYPLVLVTSGTVITLTVE
jgi:hypothetical protein